MQRVGIVADSPDEAAAVVRVKFLRHFSRVESITPPDTAFAAWRIVHPVGAGSLPFHAVESSWRDFSPESDLDFQLSILAAGTSASALASTDIAVLFPRGSSFDPDSKPLLLHAADLPACRLIIHAGPGAPGVDLESARSLGILVASVPDAASEPCAECVMNELGSQLADHPPRKGPPIRLGLVGLGSLGQAVARCAGKSGWEAWAHDPFKPDYLFKLNSIRRAPLHELAGICDLLSVQVPLCGATRGLVGADFFQFRKGGQFIVNASPDEVVDADAAKAADAPVAQLHTRIMETAQSADARVLGLERALETAGLAVSGEVPGHLLMDPPLPRWVKGSMPNAGSQSAKFV